MRPTRAPSTTASESASAWRSKMRRTSPMGVSASTEEVLVISSPIVGSVARAVSTDGGSAIVAVRGGQPRRRCGA